MRIGAVLVMLLVGCSSANEVGETSTTGGPDAGVRDLSPSPMPTPDLARARRRGRSDAYQAAARLSLGQAKQLDLF